METIAIIPDFLLEKVHDLAEGHYAECGVYWGGSAQQILTRMGHGILFYLFDTFTGLPEPQEIDKPFVKGQYRACYECVERRFHLYPEVRVFKGDFLQTLTRVRDSKFRFVHIDCDLYKSTSDCLRFFPERMVSGGIILFDDFEIIGARKAIMEEPFSNRLIKINHSCYVEF